jgi:hypothetical protein
LTLAGPWPIIQRSAAAAALMEVGSMLVIRRAQLDRLADVPRLSWMARMLRGMFPETMATWPDAELRGFVAASSARAKTRGFRAEGWLAWAALEHALGDGFPDDPEHAWAGELLQDRSLPRSLVLQRLREEAVMRLAAAAEEAEESNPA